jgi:L-ascorbate 6-phosphate lactonase
MNIWDYLNKREVKEKELAICWLGQAGFFLYTHEGKRILIDPYLSDYVNRLFADSEGQKFRRMTPMCFKPEKFHADILLSSHEHPDHLDIDSIPGLMAGGNTQGFINSTSLKELESNGIPTEHFTVLHRKDKIDFGGFTLTVTDCDHGDQTPEALGFYLDFGFLTVYYSGDTSLNRIRLRNIIQRKADIALLPINGAYGNLNAEEAAILSRELNAKVCIPHHFWTFPAHDMDCGGPLDAIRMFPEYAPECKLCLATPGEFMVFGQGGEMRG